MYFSIYLALLTWHTYLIMPSTYASDVNKKIKCLYKDTVNLTNYQHYENGSYLYEGILIPPERQHFYNFEITGSFPLKVAVPVHMRACVCDMKPCLKLCCEKDEFLSDMGKCEKMTRDMRVSWKLPILLDNGQIIHINILEHFTPQVGVICEEHVALVKDTNLWSLRENGIINVSQMPPIPTYGYCLTPHLSGETSKTVLSPYACRLLPTWRKLLNLYASLISVTLLTPTILIYALIKELRDTLSGKLLICYLVSLATMIGLVAFIKVSFINFNRTQCHILVFDETEIALNYCYSPLQLEKDSTEYSLTPFVCFAPNILSWKIYLSFFAPVISMLFLLPTLLVYIVLKELRQHMSGQLMICYVLSQIISNAIISFINISNISFGFLSCFIMGYTAYFFYLSLYLWLSVLCYDISKSFNNINAELNLRKNRKKFIIYSLYVWLSAGLATAIGILLELLPNVDEAYKTGIGLEMCFINSEKSSAIFYLYGPSLIILLFNLVIFIRLIAMIYKTRRDAARLVRNRNIYKQNALVILRLSLILGIPWIFEILSVWNRIEFLFVIADFIIAIQGFLTFVLFVMRPKVWFLIKNRFEKSDQLSVGNLEN
ncbi:G-protein coupled receptor Mth2-like [Lucilia cuprina]|uniref:G-protein coupled receptor Mth2-like n=1 Tax=Lucilia cuprina TaxID=7375 RepID=UPI001F064079|nr:G-protein coupled receptor Mth2-like [Lucilia cuprina]